MTSLLDKAKATRELKFKDVFSDDEKELVLAWLNNEVTLTQVSIALAKENAPVAAYSFLARGAKAIFMEAGNGSSNKSRKRTK
jgi:hypothetical protein